MNHKKVSTLLLVLGFFSLVSNYMIEPTLTSAQQVIQATQQYSEIPSLYPIHILPYKQEKLEISYQSQTIKLEYVSILTLKLNEGNPLSHQNNYFHKSSYIKRSILLLNFYS